MSSFEEAVIQRINQLEREVERLKRWERPIGGGGVTYHGQLTGLTDDDEDDDVVSGICYYFASRLYREQSAYNWLDGAVNEA